MQLDTYIDAMRYDDRFNGLENLVDLSVKLVETAQCLWFGLLVSQNGIASSNGDIKCWEGIF